MNLCTVSEDHPRWSVPRKAIKARPPRGQAFLGSVSGPHALSHIESGYAIPFLHRTSVVPVTLCVAATALRSVGWDLHPYTVIPVS